MIAGATDPLKGPTGVGSGKAHDEAVALSTLIEKLNERFGTEFTAADQLFFDQVTETAFANETPKEAAQVARCFLAPRGAVLHPRESRPMPFS